MQKLFFVYILTSRPNGTLYTGITSNLIKRTWEHKNKVTEGFTKQYDINTLVYYEHFLDPENAINREKRLKKYNRQWKIDLIENMNPNWKDLYEDLINGFPDQVVE